MVNMNGMNSKRPWLLELYFNQAEDIMIWSLIDGQIKIVNNNQSIFDKEEVWI